MTIGWEEPGEPQKFSLHTLKNKGGFHDTTEEDLRKAGYIKSTGEALTGVEAREARAWRKIDKWLRANVTWSGLQVMQRIGMHCVSIKRWVCSEWVTLHEFARAEKVDALEATAEWCEKYP